MDQAFQLRKLMLRAMWPRSDYGANPPLLIAVTAGRRGAGSTTLAAHLAVALVDQGYRTVLGDATASPGNLAQYCGVGDFPRTPKERSFRWDIHEALVRGPAGVLVIPAYRPAATNTDYRSRDDERFLQQLRSLGPHADVIVLDLGSPQGVPRTILLTETDRMVVVTTPDTVSVMDAYAHIKTTIAPVRRTAGLVVNRCADEHRSAATHVRLARACDRFLGFELGWYGFVPDDQQLRAALTCPPGHSPTEARSGTADHFSELAARLVAAPAGPSSRAG